VTFPGLKPRFLLSGQPRREWARTCPPAGYADQAVPQSGPEIIGCRFGSLLSRSVTLQ